MCEAVTGHGAGRIRGSDSPLRGPGSFPKDRSCRAGRLDETVLFAPSGDAAGVQAPGAPAGDQAF